MNWKSICLGDASRSFISGGTPSTKNPDFWTGPVPWITGADVVDGRVVTGRRFISESAVRESAANVVPRGGVLLVTRTGVGKIAIAHENIAISQDLTGIVVNDAFVPAFVMWAIRSQIGSLVAVQRGATIKGVLRSDVERMPIPFTGKSEQRKIVELLEHADGLRRKRTESDALADRILPALFHKMFGDPATNPNGWPRVRLETLILETRNGLYKHADFYGRGTQILKMFNILNGRLNLERVDRVELEAEELASYRLEPGDILVNRVNTPELVGKCAVIPTDLGEAVFESKNIRLRLNSDEADPDYVAHFLKTSFGHATLCQGVKHAIGMATINNSDVRNCQLPLPPITKQKEWAKHVSSVRQMTAQTDKSRVNLEALFQVLLHHAFTGELTAKWREAHLKELLAEMEHQARLLARPPEE